MYPSNPIKLSQRELNYLKWESFSPNLTHDEEELLNKVCSGEVEDVKAILQNATEHVNINCIGKRSRRWTTPLQIAAMNNDFYMIKLLLDNGAEPLKRPCPTSPYGYSEDIINDESRLERYQALCSPSYLILVNPDPIIEAMDLSAELRKLSKTRDIVDTSKENYNILKLQTNEFILALLECCNSSEEVKTLLTGGLHPTKTKSDLLVLSKAIETKQIQFVANPKCHRMVRNEWLRGQPEWHRRNGFGWTVLYHIYCFFVYLCFLPIMAIIYIIMPCSPVRYVLETPKAKYIMQILSYFLLLILTLILDLYFDFDMSESYTKRHIISSFILVHSIALLWTEVIRICTYGIKMYTSDLWNFLHLVSIISVLFDNALRPFGYFYCFNASFVAYWDTSTGFFLTVSSLRLMHCMFLNAYLGPMLLLFIAMLWDVIRFIIIFMYTVLSFAFGFYYLYFKSVEQFSSPELSIMTLMSMIFGNDPSKHIMNIAPTNITVCSVTADETIYYKIFGYTLYLVFGLLALVILLNICIAMMSDTYSRLQEHMDAYWKFFRTKIWLEYMHPNAPVLPAPYNIIPSISCLTCLWSRWIGKPRSTSTDDVEMTNSEESTIRNIGEVTRLSYKELMKILVCRYLHEKGISINLPMDL